MNYSSYFLVFSMLVGAGGCGYFGSAIYRELISSQKEKDKKLQATLDQGAEAIVRRVKEVYTIADGINRLAVAKKSVADIEAALREIVTKNSILISCGVAYAPYVYDPQKEFVSRRVVRVDQEFVTYALEAKEDYTKTEWYRHAHSGKPYWSTPFLDEISKQMIVRYTAPFYLINPTTQTQEFGGVIIASIPVLDVDSFVIEMSLDKETYAMLVHENGALLAHPTVIVNLEERTILKLAREAGNKNLLEIYNQLKQNDEGELTITTGMQNNLFKTVFKRVPDTAWFLILMRLENTNIIASHAVFRLFVLLVLALVIFFTSFFSLLFFWQCDTVLRAAWLTSSLFAALLAASIGAIWTLDIQSDTRDKDHEHVIETEYVLNHFLFLERKNNPHLYKKNPILLPTGIYITSLEPAHDGSLTINGLVWQKYDRKEHPDLEPHILFLNAVEQYLEQNSSTFKGTQETIGWSFKAKFQTQFSYLKYPFDEQEIALTLGYKEYESHIILTPDFEAYLSSDSPKSEIDPKIHSNQWQIKETYAFYELTDFPTDFGIEDYPGQKGFPNLNYGIRIRRHFVYPLTASALPIIIILFVVFSILLFTGLTIHRSSLATEIIKLTSSIFFATAIAHQTFQRSLQSPVITYFEYFYFLIYGIILFTAINGMLYAYERGGTIINSHNNLIARLIYWPVTLLLCLGLTLWFFY